MMETMGSRIVDFRKQKGYTQEQLAEQMGISPQAVSKWENDQSCPDVGIIPQLAEVLGVTLDQLFGLRPTVQLMAAASLEEIDRRMIRVLVNSANGDKVKVNLPVMLVRTLVKSDAILKLMGEGADLVRNLDFDQIFSLIDCGVMGKLVEVESVNGDQVDIFVM